MFGIFDDHFYYDHKLTSWHLYPRSQTSNKCTTQDMANQLLLEQQESQLGIYHVAFHFATVHCLWPLAQPIPHFLYLASSIGILFGLFVSVRRGSWAWSCCLLALLQFLCPFQSCSPPTHQQSRQQLAGLGLQETPAITEVLQQTSDWKPEHNFSMSVIQFPKHSWWRVT